MVLQGFLKYILTLDLSLLLLLWNKDECAFKMLLIISVRRAARQFVIKMSMKKLQNSNVIGLLHQEL